MAYLIKGLEVRYAGIPILRADTIKESFVYLTLVLNYLLRNFNRCLATIRGHKIYRLRHLMQDFIASVHLGISTASEKGPLQPIQWREASFPPYPL